LEFIENVIFREAACTRWEIEVIEHRNADRFVINDRDIADAAQLLDTVAKDSDAARDMVAVNGNVFDERPLGLSNVAEGDYGGISRKGPAICDERRSSASTWS
jgi:hypothetical protein